MQTKCDSCAYFSTSDTHARSQVVLIVRCAAHCTFCIRFFKFSQRFTAAEKEASRFSVPPHDFFLTNRLFSQNAILPLHFEPVPVLSEAEWRFLAIFCLIISTKTWLYCPSEIHILRRIKTIVSILLWDEHTFALVVGVLYIPSFKIRLCHMENLLILI